MADTIEWISIIARKTNATNDEILDIVVDKLELDNLLDIDMDIDNLPEVYVPFVRCHYKQREYIDKLTRNTRWNYQQLIKYCCKVVKRSLRDVGELSNREAQLVISNLENLKSR